jgi:hypothetical protein
LDLFAGSGAFDGVLGERTGIGLVVTGITLSATLSTARILKVSASI